jgi:hypothetical protein
MAICVVLVFFGLLLWALRDLMPGDDDDNWPGGAVA